MHHHLMVIFFQNLIDIFEFYDSVKKAINSQLLESRLSPDNHFSVNVPEKALELKVRRTSQKMVQNIEPL
jgi:hypothetical protein